MTIQYYVNLRPVPYGVARQHLGKVYPNLDLGELSRLMSQAFRKDAQAALKCAFGGVTVAQIKGGVGVA